MNPKIYQFVKTKLLEFANNVNNEEIKNKSILLYQEFKKNLFNLIHIEVNKINANNDNIKSILEYGKKSILSNNNKQNKIINNRIIKNIKTLKYDIDETSDIKTFIESNENLTNIKLNDSCDFFNSSITLSNWFEEIQNNNCLGLLIKITSSELAKMGILGSAITVQNITTSYLSIADYINTSMDYFEKNKNLQFGDLNKKNIITGMAIGEANAVIPLYINKYHWKIVKKYIEPLLGIIVSHNPFNFGNNHKSIFYTIFVDMTHRLFKHDKTNLNNNYIKTYMAYFRTCAEICFENKYNHGIKKFISLYLTNPLIRISKDNYPYDKICSQILVTGYIINNDNIKILMLYLLEELIRIRIKMDDYDETYINYVINLQNEELDNDIDMVINRINEKMPYDLEFLMTFYKMNSVMNSIVEDYGSYGKFIKDLEDNYGLVSDNTCSKILDMITKNINTEKVIIEDIYNLLNINYNKYNILAYILQGIKHKKNKTRIDAINNKECIDISNRTFDMEMIVDMFKPKIEN